MSATGANQTPPLILRPLEKRDLADILAWRNRDEARAWFKSSAVITENQHLGWFKKYSESPDDHHYIVEVGGRKVGQAAIYHIDSARKSAEIGRFLAAPGESGKGYMREACSQIIVLCRDKFGLSYVYLEVFETNTRAVGIYRACGFQTEYTENGLIRMGQHIPPKL